DKSKDSILNTYNEYKKNKTKHLKLPSDEEGWIIGDTQFLLNDLIIQDSVLIKYDQLIGLYFYAESIKHGLLTTRNVIFAIAVYDVDDNNQITDELLEIPLLVRDNKPVRLRKKSYETILILSDHIAQKSFENRLKFYYDSLAEKGYFEYLEYLFYSDGRVIDKKGRLRVDLNKITFNDISFFDISSGYKVSHSNPYEISIFNNTPEITGIFGIKTRKTFRFNTYLDNDIINLLISNFIKYKRYF